MTHTNGGVVLEAALCESDELILEIRDLSNAAASEEFLLNLVVGELSLGGVYLELAVLGKAVGDSHIECRDATLVGTPTASGVTLSEHLVLGNGTLACHKSLCNGSAVEENNLVLVVAVVVVPVKASGGLTRSESHSAHRDSARKVVLAGANYSAVVEVGNKNAGANAEDSLHLVPATESYCVEVVLVYVLVDNDGYLSECDHVLCGNKGEVCVSLEILDASEDLSVVVSLLSDLENKLGEVEGLNVDAVSLESYLVEANGLERGSSCADAAEVESLHALNNAADSCEIVKVLAELGGERINNVGLENGEGDLILIENVGYGELTAVSVAAVLEVHLADRVGISLHKDRNACVPESCCCAVLVDEDRHAEDNSVILPSWDLSQSW